MGDLLAVSEPRILSRGQLIATGCLVKRGTSIDVIYKNANINWILMVKHLMNYLCYILTN